MEKTFWFGISLAKGNNPHQRAYYESTIERNVAVVVLTSTGNNFMKRLSDLPDIKASVANEVYGYSRK